MILTVLLAWLFALSASDADSPYAWPLPFDNGISSTFMEFRSSHLHAGIDLRTYRETGFPVLALADGRIERLKMAVNDTGRSLFLRMADGRLAIYYHLQAFIPALEDISLQVQRESGRRYFGEYALPQPLPVKRGEVIAFSGESGAGFPHLHLEIRDSADRSLNPLAWLPDRSPDTYPPVLAGLLLRSRDGSLINGEMGEVYIRLQSTDQGWRLREPLIVSGPFDLAVKGWDISSGRRGVAPYSIDGWLDEIPIFSMKSDLIGPEENNQLGLLYDMAHSGMGVYFFSLVGQSRYDLNRSGVDLARRMQQLSPGEHRLRVQMSDFSGNSAVADIPFVRLAEPASEPPREESEINGVDLPFRLYMHGQDLAVCLDDWPGSPDQVGLTVIQGGKEAVIQAKPKKRGIFFPFRPLNADPLLQLRFSLFRNGLRVGEILKSLTVACLSPGQPTDLQLEGCRLSFFPGSVNVPRMVTVEQRDDLISDLPMLSRPVCLAPDDFTFMDTVLVRFPLPLAENPRQIGVFKYNPWSKHWSWVKSSRADTDGFFSARLLIPATYALLRDPFPPVVTLGRLRTHRLSALKTVYIRIRDLGMGVDGDTVRVAANGQWLDCDYDPDWQGVRFQPQKGMRKGMNRLQVTASDYAGNLTEQTLTVKLR